MVERAIATLREISSRSASVSAQRHRLRTAGVSPPFGDTTLWMEPACLPNARPISFNDCPLFPSMPEACVLSRRQARTLCVPDSPFPTTIPQMMLLGPHLPWPGKAYCGSPAFSSIHRGVTRTHARSKSREACMTDTPRSVINFTASTLRPHINFRRSMTHFQFINTLTGCLEKQPAGPSRE